MNKFFTFLILLAGLAVCIFSMIMTVMAVRFMEWGRVLFYGMIALFSMELIIFMLLKLKKKP